jgi:hypothetical protein
MICVVCGEQIPSELIPDHYDLLHEAEDEKFLPFFNVNNFNGYAHRLVLLCGDEFPDAITLTPLIETLLEDLVKHMVLPLNLCVRFKATFEKEHPDRIVERIERWFALKSLRFYNVKHIGDILRIIYTSFEQEVASFNSVASGLRFICFNVVEVNISRHRCDPVMGCYNSKQHPFNKRFTKTITLGKTIQASYTNKCFMLSVIASLHPEAL